MDPRTQPQSRHDGAPAGPAAERARGAADDAIPEMAEVRERADELVERAADFIRANPGTSLLVAAAIGYFLGRLVRA